MSSGSHLVERGNTQGLGLLSNLICLLSSLVGCIGVPGEWALQHVVGVQDGLQRYLLLAWSALKNSAFAIFRSPLQIGGRTV